MVSITLEILAEFCFFSKAKMYRYYQTGEMVTTGDVNTTSWFWAFLRCIENTVTIELNEIIADMLWSSPE